jgi:dihydroxyacetone kinase-like protein
MTDDATSLAALAAWLERFGELVEQRADELGDAAGLADGTAAVLLALDGAPAATVEELFKTAGMAIVSAGGTTGPFYGTFLLRFGMHAGTSAELSAVALAGALRAGLEGVVARSGATPAVEVLEAGIAEFDASVARGLDAAAAASSSLATARSIGTANPVALAASLLLEALASALE